MKRYALFALTNLAIVLMLGLVTHLTGLDAVLAARGLNAGALLLYALLVGFTGSIISLLLSKPMAKWSTGARVIGQPRTPDDAWLLETVQRLAQRAGLAMPEVAVYDGEPNAFATGAFRNSALVAVSTGLLATMGREELEGVLGHEVSHIANGDMVTMALLQGVVNTFVVFLSRVIGFALDRAIQRSSDEDDGPGIGSFVVTLVLQLVLGVPGMMIVAWFSRQREFRADAGSARLLGSRQPMIHALQRLGGAAAGDLPRQLDAMGIQGGGGGALALFASHPPLAERIRALESAPAP